jgi:ABC-type transport system involved in multi-copper enzyme maturation permease subunit
MLTRLIKEERDLLPVLVSMLLLIVVPCRIWPEAASAWSGIALGLSCAVLSGWVFGNEFQQRTLLLLLSQPIARSALWRDKMILLGAAILVSAGAAVACQVGLASSHGDFGLLVLSLIGLCAFCGGCSSC